MSNPSELPKRLVIDASGTVLTEREYIHEITAIQNGTKVN